MLEMLLADPALRAIQPASPQAGDDSDEYADNVIGLISEELAVVVAAQRWHLRSFVDALLGEAQGSGPKRGQHKRRGRH